MHRLRIDYVPLYANSMHNMPVVSRRHGTDGKILKYTRADNISALFFCIYTRLLKIEHHAASP